ncbi:MAG: extracellular solute-binding protein [Planctomycetota bacterium]|nr:MAG: extracellular solute-binding protein [Planctomycetota bacterium]
MSLRIPLCALAVLLCSFISCGILPAAELNIYSARHYDDDRNLFEAFTEKTGIRVNLVEDSGDKLLARIRAEGRNSPADLFITVDAGRLAAADRMGIFQPVKSEVLESAIPEQLRHAEGHWFAFGKRYRIIVYAKDRVDPSELSTYEDLVHERWRGRILVRSSSNVYNQSLLAAMIATHGQAAAESWARGLVANFARAPQGGDRPQIAAVAAGAGDVAIVNHYYALQMRDSGDPAQEAVWGKIGLFFPNQGEGERGTHTNVSGAGLLAHAPNRDHAVAFLEYLASPEGQLAWVRGSREFPVVAGVANPLDGEGFEFRGDDTVSAQTLGELSSTAMRIFDRVGWR